MLGLNIYMYLRYPFLWQIRRSL